MQTKSFTGHNRLKTHSSKFSHAHVFAHGLVWYHRNQDEFQEAMLTTMDALCQSGALGPCELVLMAGFRDKENQVVAYRLIALYFTSKMQLTILQIECQLT